MSNFSGNVKKSSSSFRPQTRASDGAGVGRVVGGVYAGQDAPVVFEKANQPVLDTTPTPRTDGRGEGELGLSGAVDHPNADGGAKYLAGKIARVYRRIVSDGADLESMSREDRRALADKLIEGVYDGDGQHPSGEAASRGQADVLTYIRQVAAVLFGLADELPGTPTFLTRSESGDMHKMEGGNDGIECPHCHTINPINKSAVGRPSATGLVSFTCQHCAKWWEANPELMLRKDAPANPTLADLRKQLAILTERLRGIIARGAGHIIESSESSGSRFVTKDKTVAERELHKALQHGTPVPFSGADPRSAAERAGGSGRKFEPRR